MFRSARGSDFCSAYFMQSGESRAPPGPEQVAFGAALEQFGQLLRNLLREFPHATLGSPDNQQLGGKLAAEFARWLLDPDFRPPWWRHLEAAPCGAQSLQPWQPFDPQFALNMHLASTASEGSDFGKAGRRWLDLMTRRSQLQTQLALLWSAFTRSAVTKFSERAATAAADLDWTNIRKLYDSWIECAEQAYAQTVHSEEFCRTQAELFNITTEMLLAQRAQVELVARAFGMPTGSELDGLRNRIRQLENEARPDSPRNRSKPRRPKRRQVE
jgi:hypothetical protein